MKIKYQPKWKEELVGSIGKNKFTIQRTIGKLHVYFPMESTWEAGAPSWAKGKWEEAREAAELWCEEQNTPLTIDDQAWVDFHQNENPVEPGNREVRATPGKI